MVDSRKGDAVNDHPLEELPERVDRIEDKLDTLTTSIDQRLDALETSVDQRFDALATSVDRRFDAVDEAFAEQREFTTFAFDTVRAEMRAGFAAVDARFDRVDARFDRLERKLDQFIDGQSRRKD